MLARIQYTQARQSLEKAIAELWTDIEKYKQRPDHNANYLEKQERRITDLMAFFKAADAAILEAEEERAAAYQRGLQAGRKNHTEPHPQTLYFRDPEALRNYSINQAKMKWPELY